MKILDVKPVFYTIKDDRPVIESMEKNEKLLADQGYSFDEAGLSFDEIGVEFGGLYGNDGNPPR